MVAALKAAELSSKRAAPVHEKSAPPGRAGLAMLLFIRDRTGNDQSHSARDILPGLFRRAQVPRKPALPAVAQRPVIVGVGGVVGVADEIGYGRVAQHSPAVGQRRATEAQHLAVREV